MSDANKRGQLLCDGRWGGGTLCLGLISRLPKTRKASNHYYKCIAIKGSIMLAA